MSLLRADHVVLDYQTSKLCCGHCGAEEAIVLPVSVTVLVDRTDSFLEQHAACQPTAYRPGAVTDPPSPSEIERQGERSLGGSPGSTPDHTPQQEPAASVVTSPVSGDAYPGLCSQCGAGDHQHDYAGGCIWVGCTCPRRGS